ncbi:MAG: TPM domain-containing protein [Sporomusaceae bacterium]|jgi:uncharacterized membrane protein YgcG|nr:TPM domain-containing protein [Sporomusaceae bacterium]
MKKIWFFLIVSVFSLLLTLPVLATPAAYVVDDAGLLQESEKAGLEKEIKKVRDKFNFDLVIVTLKDTQTSKTPLVFAADYYMDNGYGVGPARDGLILLLDMKGRDWAIVGTGQGQKVFTDWGTSDIGKRILPNLSKGEYGQAFGKFIELSAVFLQAYADGDPISKDNPYLDSSVYWICLFLSVCAGLIAALLGKHFLIKQMNPVAPEGYALHYADSMELAINKDTFLYDKVESTAKKPPPTSGKDGSILKSGSFRSGGGSSHSGSSGKF